MHLPEFLHRLTTTDTGIQTIVLAVTAIVMVAYTILTYLLWRESKKQTSLAQTPFPVLRYEKQSNKWTIENVGNAIAIKIEIEGQTLLVADHKDEEYEIVFMPVEMLSPGKTAVVCYKILSNGKEIDARHEIAEYFFSRYPSRYKQPKQFQIQYKNIFGRRYFFDVTYNAEDFRIVRFGPETMRRRLIYSLRSLVKDRYVRFRVWIKRRNIQDPPTT